MRVGRKIIHKQVAIMRLERVLRNYELAEGASYLQPQTQPPKKGLCKETSYELSLTNDLVGSRIIQIVRAHKPEVTVESTIGLASNRWRFTPLPSPFR